MGERSASVPRRARRPHVTTVNGLAANVITAASIATGAIDADALAADAANEIADAVLTRNASNVEATAGEHTLCTVILAMFENDLVTTPGSMIIYRTNGVTTHVTKALTTDAAAEPITSIS